MKVTRYIKEGGGLWLHEWVMVAYALLTLLFMVLNWNELVSPAEMIKTRLTAMGVIAIGWCVTRVYSNIFTRYLRVAMVLITLSIWYPDTYEINRIFPSFDHVFARWDQDWFGCQPSLLFSQVLPQWWVSELFCMGYFSYFPMMYVLVTWFAFRMPQHLSRVAFTVLISFYLYYFIYMFLPVGGPQFYYAAPGVDPVQGIFPEIGHYFRDHQNLYPMPGEGGFFRKLVEMAQQAGERPTAAFPSSHIGVSTILLILCKKYRQKGMFLCFLPFYLFLCCATVYIHAHYLVDAIFGFISAFVVYWMGQQIYENLGGDQRWRRFGLPRSVSK